MASPKVLLIGWDAADWKIITPLMDAGEMPNLARFVEQGVMGNIQTLYPVLSPMLWNSIATGKYADEHGILGFTEVDAASGRVRPVTSTSRKTKALWNILHQNGLKTNVVHWFGSHPAEPLRGVCVSEALSRGWPGPGEEWPEIPGTVHPAALAAEFMDLRVRPDEIDSSLIQMFVPRAAEVDQEKDQRLTVLARLQAECFTVHAAATQAMHKHPWDFMAVFYPSIDHFSHAFMRYHPPRVRWVDEKSFDLYNGVVTSAYRFHDMALGTLLQLAGPGTTVILVSDHGFHSDHLRQRDLPDVPAGPADEHRNLGIFAMQGPGVCADERVYGATLLDIAPTVLAAFGLPAGRDMPGRVLSEAFHFAPRLERIESWDRVPGDCGSHDEDTAISPRDAQALIEQFVALGYIEQPDAGLHRAVETCLQERLWNLARVYASTARWELALPILEQLHTESPERPDFAVVLASCQARLGLFAEARAVAQELLETHPRRAAALWVAANVAYTAGDYPAAISHLLEACESGAQNPAVLVRLGQVYSRLRKTLEARDAFERALIADPGSARAYEGLARCYLREHAYPEAADYALRAVGYQFNLQRAHLYFGIALGEMGQLEQAVEAIRTAASFPVPMRAAHIWLARLYARMPGFQHLAWEHRKAAFELGVRHRAAEERRRELRQQAGTRSEPRATIGQPARAPSTAVKSAKQTQELVLVSGLPRSGTSLMMQMLHRGGMPVMTDGERQADSDNPEGYYEWEPIKKVRHEPEILDAAEGKAVKVISMLIPALPAGRRYKVIFMHRPIDQVIVSHMRMLENRGKDTSKLNTKAMQLNLERHRSAVLKKLVRDPSYEFLLIDYPSLVHEPDPWIAKILQFLGAYKLDAELMRLAIRPQLHRNRPA